MISRCLRAAMLFLLSSRLQAPLWKEILLGCSETKNNYCSSWENRAAASRSPRFGRCREYSRWTWSNRSNSGSYWVKLIVCSNQSKEVCQFHIINLKYLLFVRPVRTNLCPFHTRQPSFQLPPAVSSRGLASSQDFCFGVPRYFEPKFHKDTSFCRRITKD